MADNKSSVSALQALKAELKEKQFQRLYIFHGEETFLLHYYLEQLKKNLVDPLTESFNYHKFTDENFDINAFADAVENLPMMAESTFIWADDIDIFTLPESEKEQLIDLVQDIPSYCTVIFSFENNPWKPDGRLKLSKTLTSCASIVSFDKQDPRDLIAWITRHFSAEKKRITPDLCRYLIELTGGTMTALANEISKICAYSDAEQIVKSDIDAVMEPVLDAVSFQMTNFMGQGNYGAAMQKLQQLFKMQQEPIMILGSVGKHFRQIGVARTLHDNGKNASELMRLYKMTDYPARKTMDTATRFSARFCRVASQLIMETDNAMKTSYDDPQRLLEVLVLRLAQEARNG